MSPALKQTNRPPGAVRIIAGHWRGRKLPVPAVPGLRPTPDRVRETLFNWLMPVVEGSRCLDLFAGSGALGLEAASRGAAEVVLVENEARALAALRENVVRLRADGVRIEAADALAFLRQVPARPFDIVFVDPPYASGLAAPAISALLAGGWLGDDAWIYTEWPDGREAPLAAQPWREGRAGEVRYALHRPFHGRPVAG